MKLKMKLKISPIPLNKNLKLVNNLKQLSKNGKMLNLNVFNIKIPLFKL
jgi:hypothetical protein